jgi:nickel/cobalt exporter
MADWIIVQLAQMQGGIMRGLAADLRAGGLGSAALAFALGALHALTPGHGKAALAAYLFGREASILKGFRIALTAASLHVISGFCAFLILSFVVGQIPSLSGRGSPLFTVFGYALIVIAGFIMLIQSLRPSHAHHDGAPALMAGMGLLPCPLTISVLGFAWLQGSGAMVVLVLVSLALGIALTIGIVALLAILARQAAGQLLGGWLSGLDRWGRTVQGVAGAVIIAIGIYTVSRLYL